MKINLFRKFDYTIIMMMKKNCFLNLILLLLVCSCGNESKTESTDNDSSQVSSMPAEVAGLQQVISKFKEITTLPLMIDSVFLSGIPDSNPLSGNELKLIAKDFIKHDLNNSTYDLEEFYKIDSLRSIGKYETYLNQIDIGMTKESSCFALGKIKVADDTELLLWALKNSSYEACPYFSGTSVHYTLIHKNTIGESMLIGETYGAGDPPVSMERMITSVIKKDGLIEMIFHEVNDEDMDAPQISVTNGSYVIQIENGRSVFKKDKTDKPAMVNRPIEE